jgi:hypothetical protein
MNVSIKQGDVFGVEMQYVVRGADPPFEFGFDDEDDPSPPAGEQVIAQVRDELGALVETLTPTLGEQGEFTLSCSDTSAWPLGTLRFDVLIVAEGRRTPTFEIEVIAPVTVVEPEE